MIGNNFFIFQFLFQMILINWNFVDGLSSDLKKKDSQLKEMQVELQQEAREFLSNYYFNLFYLILRTIFPVYERPSSQMSYLEHFLKETAKDRKYCQKFTCKRKIFKALFYYRFIIIQYSPNTCSQSRKYFNQILKHQNY